MRSISLQKITVFLSVLFTFGHQCLSMESENNTNTILLAHLKLWEENNIIKNNLSNASITSVQSITSFEQEKRSIFFQIFKRESEEEINIGYIDFYLKNGIPDHIQSTNDPIIIKQQFKKSAFLRKIQIDEAYQGKGYGKAALTAFHDFLDKGEIDFTILVLDSKMPYAGNFYIKHGYIFTPNTLELITRWAQKQGVSSGEEEKKYLEDTTKSLRPEDTMQVENIFLSMLQDARLNMPAMVRYLPHQ